jgi:hypothetical protein
LIFSLAWQSGAKMSGVWESRKVIMGPKNIFYFIHFSVKSSFGHKLTSNCYHRLILAIDKTLLMLLLLLAELSEIEISSCHQFGA